MPHELAWAGGHPPRNAHLPWGKSRKSDHMKTPDITYAELAVLHMCSDASGRQRRRNPLQGKRSLWAQERWSGITEQGLQFGADDGFPLSTLSQKWEM